MDYLGGLKYNLEALLPFLWHGTRSRPCQSLLWPCDRLYHRTSRVFRGQCESLYYIYGVNIVPTYRVIRRNLQ